MDAALVAGVSAALLLVWVVTARLRRPTSRAVPPPPPQLDVALVEVAMPAGALSTLRDVLAAGGHTSFGHRIQALAVALVGAERDWTHVAVRSFAVEPAADADRRFAALTAELAGREALAIPPDEHDGYRGDDRAPERGPRHSLVSIVALSTTPIAETPPASPESARAILDALVDAAPQLASGAVIWLPEHTSDGLPGRELRARAARLVEVAVRER